MSVMNDENSNPLSGRNDDLNSGFMGEYGESGRLDDGLILPNSKYYDDYSYGINKYEYTRRKLGDATGEMGLLEVKYIQVT